MINSFDTDVAIDVGVNAAIIYRNIQYWCEKNRTNNQHFHEGYFWTYNSISAFCEQFPYLTKRQVEIALKTLEEKGYIKSGNFNKVAYDRTKWYADMKCDMKCEMECTDNVKCISHTSEIDFAPTQNGIHTEGEPIPNINPNINQIEKDIYIEDTKAKPKRFIPPTVEEVSEYCSERNNDIDAQKFVDYYSSNGWKVGKNKMVDWKACVRTWERNDYGKPIGQTSKPQEFVNPFTELKRRQGRI
jgi:hypothetical protein